ncbi:unnamed protein product [Rangifer tarandus platyrhynchus]|uniref:Uncharacterized protein n=1 Tax=Rangifer tarandus platyrhynchus TaxID=3082113 RepID=A0ABN8YIE6_RANTA|nr:unnamed protein product [Rangifer tarandus platyrhynchus]
MEMRWREDAQASFPDQSPHGAVSASLRPSPGLTCRVPQVGGGDPAPRSAADSQAAVAADAVVLQPPPPPLRLLAPAWVITTH